MPSRFHHRGDAASSLGVTQNTHTFCVRGNTPYGDLHPMNVEGEQNASASTSASSTAASTAAVHHLVISTRADSSFTCGSCSSSRHRNRQQYGSQRTGSYPFECAAAVAQFYKQCYHTLWFITLPPLPPLRAALYDPDKPPPLGTTPTR